MRRVTSLLFLILLLLMPGTAFAQCTPVTITANGTIPSYTQQFTTALGTLPPYFGYVYGGFNFPFTVPDGSYLGITDIHFASKHIIYLGENPTIQARQYDIYRNSYLMFWGLITVTSSQESVHFTRPIPLPPGFVLDGALSNASYEGQNMNVMVLAWLSPDILFRDCR